MVKPIISHKFTAYILVVITVFSSLCAVYIFGEYRTLQENLNQTTLELNNASDRLVEAYEIIEEQNEERAETIQALLHYYDLWIEHWEGLGVQPGDLAIKSDISPLYSFVIVYPESLVPDEYAEAILRICRQARTEISARAQIEDSSN